MTYAHTNIIAADWQTLAQFYQEVFNCTPVPPRRQQSGAWLDRGTGVQNASIQGIHLRLPGGGDSGPTLEIYQYAHMESKPSPAPNRQGLGHLAFTVDDVAEIQAQVLAHGGRNIGQISETTVEGVGTLTFIYMADPEGNLLEIQNWR
ncbi:MAG: VOC family protein [Bacteroidota bacterium]